MNNVDDGIEIWGGTFNLKNFAVWNIGDDSLDIDQGYRGKVQFGLIVQGYSIDTSQGGGVGDNCIETDGAENSDWQPVTTTTMYNLTVVGQPGSGDGATTWRDGARVQYRNCIFMDCGERVVRFDNLDGDGALGYGHNGTTPWLTLWSTPFNTTSLVNPFPGPDPLGDFYRAQSSGNLCEITDSVFFRNLAADAYSNSNGANDVGVFNPANNNVLIPGFSELDSPIRAITRGPLVIKGEGSIQLPVIYIDPRPKNEATTSVAAAPGDGFFTSANYRGAFAPNGPNWLKCWTAADAFGFFRPERDARGVTPAPRSLSGQ